MIRAFREADLLGLLRWGLMCAFLLLMTKSTSDEG
jgi:hypothetical protein